jgi:hypothetical protein
MIENARGRFPGAGFNSFDDEHMQVICPTAQVLYLAAAITGLASLPRVSTSAVAPATKSCGQPLRS